VTLSWLSPDIEAALWGKASVLVVVAVGTGLFALNPVRADNRYPKLQGAIADSSAAVLPGTTVTAFNVGTGLIQTCVSGPQENAA
jgi:hypothetical protein